MKKPRIPAITFVKGISAMGVVCSHFFTQMTNMDTSRIMLFENGYWGGAWVQCFLIASGFLLHYHYSDHLELKTYAVRRWRSIFPMFYIAYLFFMYGKVCDARTVFYYYYPWAYILTLLGMDGYLMGRLPSYYIVGEWFLGVIIILYILYPLLRKAFLKNSIATFAATVALYLIFHEKTITSDVGLWSVSSCMVSFALGMLISRYQKQLTGKWSVLVSAVLLWLLVNVHLCVGQNIGCHLAGAVIFILAFAIGERLMRLRVTSWFFQMLGDLSYPVFLVHNQIIPRIAGSWRPGNPIKCWFLFFVVCALSLAAGKALEVVTRSVVAWCDTKLAMLKQRKQAAQAQ